MLLRGRNILDYKEATKIWHTEIIAIRMDISEDVDKLEVMGEPWWRDLTAKTSPGVKHNEKQISYTWFHFVPHNVHHQVPNQVLYPAPSL